ncbi:hypothetical protein L7F22_061745 [Adiantum nelumboides]|nr:hypothetical protein [Adiantum nelumboides]
MDTSNHAVLVNAELLNRFSRRRVRCVVKVVRAEGNSAFVGLTSDGMHIFVKQTSPIASLSQFVEVIGVADSDRSLLILYLCLEVITVHKHPPSQGARLVDRPKF